MAAGPHHATPPAALPATRTVGILGGMGPAAGVDFARLFVAACARRLAAAGVPVTDQTYPEHWLAQLPVVDRTAALADADAPQPLEPLARALGQLEGLGAVAVAMACNTAHAWHARLQARCPQIELLHIARETARHLRAAGHAQAVLLSTTGTLASGVYDQALQEAGIACHRPDATEQATLMRGIYQGVKAGDMALGSAAFAQVAQAAAARHPGAPLLMACTEIPLALPQADGAAAWTLVDPGAVLAEALAQRALVAP